MVDINSTLPPLFEPVVETIQGFVNIVQVLVGGIFGLYLILVILRWREARQLKKVMKEVKDELKLLNRSIESMNSINLTRKRK